VSHVTRLGARVLRAHGALAVVATLLAPAARLVAQGDAATEGALFLVLPVGARAVGMGQAVVAAVDGSEAVWWNPAGLARQQKREIAIHHSQPFSETTGDALSLVVPSSLLGVLALSVNIIDYGSTEIRDINERPGGTITPRNFAYAASYATAVGSRLNAGVTYKVVQFRVSCSLGCPPGLGANATSSAIDVGAQYDLRGLVPLQVGFALRNVGPSLQVKDNPQRDPLPARAQLGVRWRAGPLERRAPETEIGITGDVLASVRDRTTGWSAGIDATWRKRASLRAGYVLDRSEAGGPAVGFGLRQGGLVVDVGQRFGGAAEATGADPVFVSLRYQF
jgi:hypothetical protein